MAIPHSFFVKERRMYSNWTVAFWRELVQNAVDAGAGRIAIDIRQQEGADGEPRTVITFDDNGGGMSRDVLETVYFRLGATTKDQDSQLTGGFGRARILTCFGADSFEIHTRDSIARSILEHDAGGQRLGGMYEIVDAETPHKGCRLTIAFKSSDVEVRKMLEALHLFLRSSQLKPRIEVSHEHDAGDPNSRQMVVWTDWLKRNRAIANLETEDQEGRLAAFATVHSNRRPHWQLENTAVFRLNGMAMFEEHCSLGGKAAVIELDPEATKRIGVLNANRDSLAWPHSRVVDRYLEYLATNASQEMRERKPEQTLVEGARGALQARNPHRQRDPEPGSDVPDREQDWSREPGGGAPEAQDVERAAFERPAPVGGWRANGVEPMPQFGAGEADPRQDRCTVVFLDEGIDNPQQRAAMQRFKAAWDDPDSKAARTVNAWITACEASIDALYQVRPYMSDFEWVPGVVFSKTAGGLNHKEGERHILYFNPLDHEGEEHERRCRDGRKSSKAIEAGANLRYTPSNEADRRALFAIAMHEVAHCAVSGHAEEYAGVLTRMMAVIDQKEALKAMHTAALASNRAVSTSLAAGGLAEHHRNADGTDGGHSPLGNLIEAALGTTHGPGAAAEIEAALVEHPGVPHQINLEEAIAAVTARQTAEAAEKKAAEARSPEEIEADLAESGWSFMPPGR
jgi:hypothetical protein